MKLSENNKLSIIIGVILSVLLVSSSIFFLEEIKLQDKIINDKNALLDIQNKKISSLETKYSELEKNRSLLQELLKNETLNRQKLEDEIINITTVTKIEHGILAIDELGKGHVIPLEIIIKSGKGSIFLNVANVVFDESLQSSANTAVKVARTVSRVNMNDKDILINIKAPIEEDTVTIQGGSAGGEITIAAIAAMQNKKLRKDVIMTGTIREDHTIGRIGGERAKGIAAKENGAVLFLVPTGQKSSVGDIGIEVKEVSTVEQAMTYILE